MPQRPRSLPPKPPLEALRQRLDAGRAQSAGRSRDGFVRESFLLPRQDARAKAREWFDRWPKQAYWTEVESWAERGDDRIEFTMRRLPSAD